MMSGRKKIALGLALIGGSLPTAVLSQQDVDDGLQAAIITAVAQSLGADPASLPSYDAELKTARRTADVAAVCGPTPKAQFLTPEIADKVIARAVNLLQQKNALISERPRYIRDLIVISAISFEAGRLAGTSTEYRAALCAPPPAPEPPQPATLQ